MYIAHHTGYQYSDESKSRNGKTLKNEYTITVHKIGLHVDSLRFAVCYVHMHMYSVCLKL